MRDFSKNVVGLHAPCLKALAKPLCYGAADRLA